MQETSYYSTYLYDPSCAIFVTMVPIFISILHILIYEEKENILMGFFLHPPAPPPYYYYLIYYILYEKIIT